MAHIHKITAVQALKELTEAVKATQGSKKTASWKASERPCWWIDDHPVTLHDNSRVRTGIFDGTGRRKWKKTHIQAALFLYEQWRATGAGKQERKEEPKAEDEIKEEPSTTGIRKKREQKEESAMPPSVPQQKPKKAKGTHHAVGEATEVGQAKVEDISEEEEETKRQPRTRRQGIIRARKEMVSPPKLSPAPTLRASSRRASSSSEQTDGSPTPVIRRTRAQVRRKQAPNVQSPLREPPAKKPLRRTGKAITRQAPKIEARAESIPQPPESNLSTPLPRQPGKAHCQEEDEITASRLRREETLTTNRRSPRLSASSIGSPPSSASPKARKRALSDEEDQSTTRPSRGPLQELQDNTNIQDNRSKKKRRVTDSEEASSGKENQAPQTDKSNSVRLRSTRGRKDKTGTLQSDGVETEAANDNDGSEEQEAVYDSARQEKEKQKKIRREKIKSAEAERDHTKKRYDKHYVEYEADTNLKKRQLVEKLRAAYRTKKLKFSRQILDMPISKFADEHGGSVDEWLLHDTEDGVNKTFQALQKGEEPRVGMMGPPRTPTAMSRRAALFTTARKTRRKVAENAPANGFTIRRSQRTAAKVATERTRAIVSCNLRTARKQAPAPQNVQPPQGRQPLQTPTRNPRGGTGPLPNSPNICTRQQFAALLQSIQKRDDPDEAIRQFTAQLQRGLQ